MHQSNKFSTKQRDDERRIAFIIPENFQECIYSLVYNKHEQSHEDDRTRTIEWQQMDNVSH